MTDLLNPPPPPPATGPKAAPAWPYVLILALLAILVAGFGLAARSARQSRVDSFDQVVHDWVVRHRENFPGITAAARAATGLGNQPVASILVLLVTAALVVLRARRVPRIARGEAAFWLILNASGWLAASALKSAFQRQRPPEEFWLVLAGSYSFPSIHSSFSAIFFGGLAAMVWNEGTPNSPRLRISLVALCLFAAASVAASRVWLGVHYATDVLGGSTFGLGWVLASWTVRSRWASARRIPPG